MSKIEKITKQLQHEQADAAWITTLSMYSTSLGIEANLTRDYLHY